MSATVAALLARAAQQIEWYGHVKGCYFLRNGLDPFSAPCCARGAIRLAAGLHPYRLYRIRGDVDLTAVHAAEQALGDYLTARGDIPSPHLRHITAWNDDPSRVLAEVTKALLEAATQESRTAA